MAYTTLAAVKAYLQAGGVVPSPVDDLLLTSCVTRAQALIEGRVMRTFETRTETRKFDVPRGRQIDLDDDLLSITTLTNGDGSVIAASEYFLLPRNHIPKHAIRLNQGSAVSWMPGTTGDTEYVISVAGAWGYSTVADDDIVQATLRLAVWLYRQKDTSADVDRPILASGGTIIMPSRLPADVEQIIAPYVRRQ
jgi:hypothetical protein